MALAIGAVACLSSIIVQWSAHFPDQENVVEHPLFGDLAEEDDFVSDQTTSPHQTATAIEARPQLVPVPKPVASAELSGIEPVDVTIEEPPSFVTRVRFTEPTAPQPSSLQTVSYSTSNEDAAWLSGAIEEGAPDAGRPTSNPDGVVQLGTILPEE